MKRRKVKFQRVCSYCKKPVGVKYDYPPREWDGKEPLITHGCCYECKKKVLEGKVE
jgi:hypothetical protein